MTNKENVCNLCAGVAHHLLDVQVGVSPEQARGLALGEFDDLIDGRVCQERLVCLPRLRLLTPDNERGQRTGATP